MTQFSAATNSSEQKETTKSEIKSSQKRDALELANLIYDMYKETQANVSISSEITEVSND